MTIQETIEKAIEGGYVISLNASEEVTCRLSDHLFLDPLFWQSLGKAMGWEEEKDNAGETEGDGKWHSTRTFNSWLDNWHRFIDHLADGGTPESFFKNL